MITFSENLSVPHPFPYQGSKRNIAKYILPYFPSDVDCLIEPFCGAAGISIAATAYGLVDKIVLNDLNEPLMSLWKKILDEPEQLGDQYSMLWLEQQQDPKAFFYSIRDEFNRTHEPYHLLYLLARIVKGAVRYSADGTFNQSADNRRSGMLPGTMKKNIERVSRLLRGKTRLCSLDFRDVAFAAGKSDLVYMDPPYQGTSFTRDHRYCNGLKYEAFVESLKEMNRKDISYIISYDGVTGDKQHGKLLPDILRLKHLLIHAGRSTQSTLLGGNDETVESLYLSSALVNRLEMDSVNALYRMQHKQQELVFA